MLIKVDGLSIELIRKKIKNIHLRIYPPDGVIRVTAPFHVSETHIHSFIKEKRQWILNSQSKLKNTSPPAQNTLDTGHNIPFLGKNYLLIVKEHNGPAKIQLVDNLMQLYSAKNATLIDKLTLLEAWYRQQMYQLVPSLMDKWSAVVGVEVKQWGIKKMKTRWGSCNIQAHRIWLNLNLIQKPQICLEYVLVHELVHLLEPSHNQRFHDLMSQFMPNWPDYQKLLEPNKGKPRNKDV